MKTEAEDQFGSYWANYGEGVHKERGVSLKETQAHQNNMIYQMQFLKILQLWPPFPRIDCCIICNIKKLGKYTITLKMLCI